MHARTPALGLAMLLLFAGCTSSGESVALESFTFNGVVYDFATFPNTQGPDAPCVGVTANFANGLTSTVACPTETAEETGYAAVIDLRGVAFIVGFGLARDENLVTPDAVLALTTSAVDGRRFFLIQPAARPGSGPVEVPIAEPDGTMRSIQGHGPGE